MLSMLDRLWHPDLTEAEALQLHEKGIAEATPGYCLLCPRGGCLLSQLGVCRSRSAW